MKRFTLHSQWPILQLQVETDRRKTAKNLVDSRKN